MNCYAPIQNYYASLLWRSKENGGWNWKDIFLENIVVTPRNILSMTWKQKYPAVLTVRKYNRPIVK